MFFKGLLSGKQCELFGFQMRTLLSQIEIQPARIRLFDWKISDPAGTFKVDNVAFSALADDQWKVSIPRIKISEFRPSLLQKRDQKPDPVVDLWLFGNLTFTNCRGFWRRATLIQREEM